MTTTSVDSPVNTRIYVGSISQQLSDSIDDLSTRFSKYGKVVKDIELHKKPTLDSYFGYITLEITPQKFGELKKAFNKVKFKSSVLTIDAAKPDYQQRWAADKARKDPPLTKVDALRKYGKKRREIDVIPGRMRTTPRKKYKYMTFRIFIGDKKIMLKCHKKKLWGIVKDKKFDEMIWRYSNRKWLDGNGDVIESVDFQPIQTKTGISLIKKDDKDKQTTTATIGSTVEDDEEEAERQRNLDILEKMFGGATENFMPKASIDTRADDDVPIKPESESEDTSSSDSDSSSDDDSSSDSDSDSDNEDESEKNEWEEDKHFKKVDQIESTKPKAKITTEEDVEMEDVSTKKEILKKPTNSTSTLRSLFNPTGDSGGFNLFGSNTDDIDEDMDNEILKEIDEAEAAAKSQASKNGSDPYFALNLPKVNKVRKGLFFGHFESPFLASQSQVALLPTLDFDSEKWEEEFQEKRSSWSKKFKGRRKEALRQIEKKNKARRRNHV